MKLSYEEIEKYHNNGLLKEILTKTNMSWQDVMDVMFKQMGIIEAMEVSYDNAIDRQESLEEEVDQLEKEISGLREELSELMSSYQDLEEELQLLQDNPDE